MKSALSNMRSIGLVLALMTSFSVSAANVYAETCNCSSEGQCAAGTCCFVTDDCMVTEKECRATWDDENDRYHCNAVGTCQYNGPGCGDIN